MAKLLHWMSGMRQHIFLFVAALVPLAIAACSGAADGPVETRSGTPPPSSGYGYDAGGGPADAPVAPEAEASAPPSIPPIDATPPGNAPVTCADGNPPSSYFITQDGTLFRFDPSTLDMHALGVPSCPTTGTREPDLLSLAVSPSGSAYVLWGDGNLYEVDLGTLACTKTAYAPGQQGFGMTLGAGSGSDRLWTYTPSPTPSLAVSDLSSFLQFQTGAIAPAPPSQSNVDITMDAYGRLYSLFYDGTLSQLDPATGAVVGQDHTGFNGWTDGNAEMALMAYGDELYFFTGSSGILARYDVSTKELRPLGLVGQAVTGASAVPCVGAPSPTDAGADAGTEAGPGPPANPFSAGDAWIGTYVCQQGLTALAVVVDSVDGNTIHARFDFDWVAGNASGSFVLDGTFDPTTREATFAPGDWVSQPGSTWETVGLDGYVDLSGQQLSGNVTHDGCGAFSVQR